MRERYQLILQCLVIFLVFTYTAFTTVIWKRYRGMHKDIVLPFVYAENTSGAINTYLPFDRVAIIPDKTPNFLPNFKNPCWREKIGNDLHILCVPYYFLIGVEKCGTTDLHRRLLKHPLISRNVKKENHWIARLRFEQGSQSLSMYLGIFHDAVQKDITTIQQDGFYNAVFGDASVSTVWDNKHLLLNILTKNMTNPPYTNANAVYRLNPRAKIIVIIRNPVTRLYSSYLFFYHNVTNADFHKRVVASVQIHNNCLKNNSERYCAYFVHGQIRLHVGLYSIYIEDYLRVFPREQIKVIRKEEFERNIAEIMKEIFIFLEIDIPGEHTMQEIKEQDKTNTNTRLRHIVGDMYPTTKAILYNFYKPYNDRLAELLGEKYNYN